MPKRFTRPTWWNALRLLTGAILAPGKRTVTAALRILGREQDTDFPIYHGVLNRAVWSSRAVAAWLLRLLVATFLDADAIVVVGIDDTIERRWGHKISARGIYRDPVRSSKGHFVKCSGLRWLSAQLLVHIPWANRIMGLPFLTMLAPSKRFYGDKPCAPKTLLDWARQAALQIHRWLPGRRIVIVGDTAFAAIEFLAAVRTDVSVVTRLRLDANLYAPVPPGRRGRGRPPDQGKAPAQTQSAAAQSQHYLATSCCLWYGREGVDPSGPLERFQVTSHAPFQDLCCRKCSLRQAALQLRFLATALRQHPLAAPHHHARPWPACAEEQRPGGAHPGMAGALR